MSEIESYHQLQPTAVDDLVVNNKFTAIIMNDKNTDTATAMVKSLSETLKELALVKNRKTLLDVASLSHSDDAAIMANV
jgi:hypothetical protein